MKCCSPANCDCYCYVIVINEPCCSMSWQNWTQVIYYNIYVLPSDIRWLGSFLGRHIVVFIPHWQRPAFSVYVHRSSQLSATAPGEQAGQRLAKLPLPGWLTVDIIHPNIFVSAPQEEMNTVCILIHWSYFPAHRSKWGGSGRLRADQSINIGLITAVYFYD